MQSIRSRIIISMIRNRHLFKGQWKRPVIDSDFSVEEFRLSTEKAAALMNRKIEKGLPFEMKDIEGEWIGGDGSPAEKMILYIHGGGFFSGSCDTHRSHVMKFMKAAGVKALLFNYRLAPEHPFPAALEDIFTVYKGLLEEGYKPSDIVIAGESAGGTLTLSVLKKIRETGLPQPAGAVSISPVTDMTCSAPSFVSNAGKDIAPLGPMRIWTDFYIGDADPADPLLSPQFGNLEGLAPTLLVVGTHEIHYDDTLGYYKNAEAAGSPVQISVYKNMVHAFPILAPLFPEAVRAMEEIGMFIRSTLKITSG